MISELPLEKFINTLKHAEGVVLFVDPTLYQKVLYGQGADNLQTIKEIAGAALKVKAAVARARKRYLERAERETRKEAER